MTATVTELDDVEFLRRGLALGNGFQLYLVAADSLDSRQHVIKELRASDRFQVALLTGSAIAGRTLVAAIVEAFAGLDEGAGRPVVVLSEIDELVVEDPRLLARLNEQRNELIRGSHGAIVILAGSELVQTLRRAAPDTWSLRAADLYIEAPPLPSMTTGTEHPRLQPIKPPRSSEERLLLEAELARNPKGTRRAQIAHRLAEICDIEGADSSVVGALFLDAANHHEDTWQSVLARINAGRAFTIAGDRQRAEGVFLEALEQASAVEPGLRAYALDSVAGLKIDYDEVEAALDFANQAIHAAFEAREEELLGEVRLRRAQIFRSLGDRQRALEDVTAAEANAVEAGSPGLAQNARKMRGLVAAELGFERQTRSSWERFIAQAADSNRSAFTHLVSRVIELDETAASESAAMAWNTLVAIANHRGLQADLAVGLIESLTSRVIWRGEPFDFGPSRARIDGLFDGRNQEILEANLRLLRVRQALNQNDQDTIRELLNAVLDYPEDIFATVVLRLVAKLTHIFCLAAAGKESEAIDQLTELVRDPDRRPFLVGYLAAHARRHGKLQEVPLPERAVVELTVKVAGGMEVLRGLLDLFTGGRAGAILSFLPEPPPEQVQTKIPSELEFLIQPAK